MVQFVTRERRWDERARDDTLHTLKLELTGLRVISTQSRAALLRRNTHIDILSPASLSLSPSLVRL